MQAQNVMTQNPACCLMDTGLQDVARMMVEHDCGSIPVVEDKRALKLAGMITDRDIICRTVARGKNPLDMTAGECMSSPVVSVKPDTSLEECCRIMEASQVRRIPVVDARGALYGMLTQAHIARHVSEVQTGEVLKQVSKPTGKSSQAA